MVASHNAEDFIFVHPSGSVECKLCLSTHASYASYYSHAQGKWHLRNLDSSKSKSNTPQPAQSQVQKRKFSKIGIPKYNITKIRDPKTLQLGVRLSIEYPEIKSDVEPQFRLMSSYEQTVDEVDTKYRYLVVAAEPYDSVASRIPSTPIDDARTLSYFNPSDNSYHVQLLFQNDD